MGTLDELMQGIEQLIEVNKPAWISSFDVRLLVIDELIKTNNKELGFEET